MKQHSTLPQPIRPLFISEHAKWLAGEGAGSWFVIESSGSFFRIRRYSPQGKPECEGEFTNATLIPFDINQPFELTYLSHCGEVSIIQDDNLIVMKRRPDSFFMNRTMHS